MLELLSAPIDPSRAHDVGMLLSWHGRLMVLGWGLLAPLAVLVARFGKIWPGQDWPRELDNPTWWRLHWMTQTLVLALALVAVGLVLFADLVPKGTVHRVLGYATLALGLAQVAGGLLRGSKGGPTDSEMRGDHFDMTKRRVMFEAIHKSSGYLTVLLAQVTIFAGIWTANAPVWMFLGVIAYCCAILVAFVILQRKGRAIDTYQAIWGNDPALPGNRLRAPGWGMRRPGRNDERNRDVWND